MDEVSEADLESAAAVMRRIGAMLDELSRFRGSFWAYGARFRTARAPTRPGGAVTLPPMPQPSLSFDPIDEARRHWEERWSGEAATEMVAVTSIMRAQQIVMARLNDLLEPSTSPSRATRY